MVSKDTVTLVMGKTYLYAHGGVTHNIRVGKSRHIRNISCGEHLSSASDQSLVQRFSFSIYHVNIRFKEPTNYPSKLFKYTSEVLTQCQTK